MSGPETKNEHLELARRWIGHVDRALEHATLGRMTADPLSLISDVHQAAKSVLSYLESLDATLTYLESKALDVESPPTPKLAHASTQPSRVDLGRLYGTDKCRGVEEESHVHDAPDPDPDRFTCPNCDRVMDFYLSKSCPCPGCGGYFRGYVVAEPTSTDELQKAADVFLNLRCDHCGRWCSDREGLKEGDPCEICKTGFLKVDTYRIGVDPAKPGTEKSVTVEVNPDELCECGHPRRLHTLRTFGPGRQSHTACSEMVDGFVCGCTCFKPAAKDSPFDVCECGHFRGDHSVKGFCTASAGKGVAACTCTQFRLAATEEEATR